MNELLAAAQPIAAAIGVDLPTAAGLFTRLSLLLFLMPGLGGLQVPARVRLALALGLLGLLLPLTPRAPGGSLALLLMGEAAAGFVTAFTIRVLLFALSFTASIVAQSLSLSQVLGVPADGDSSGVLSNMLVLTAATLFLTADLEIAALRAFTDNMEAVPIGFAATMDAALLAENAVLLTAQTAEFGILLALPFMVLNFAYYLILGFLNRAMPQLMITFVGLPAITLSGLILLMVTTGAVMTVWLARASELLAP